MHDERGDGGARGGAGWALAAGSRVAGHAIYLGTLPGRGAAFAPPEHGALVLGPPRSGKTTGIVVPNVLAAAGSVLAASTKPDVLLATSPGRRALGRCMLFDPSGTTPPPAGVDVVGWSPLAGAHSWDAAVLTAEAMVGAARPGGERGESAHWTERSGALLACVLHAAALDGASLDVAVSSVNRHDGDRFSAVLSRSGAGMAHDLLAGILETDGREQSGIWSTLSGVLSCYRTTRALESARARPLDAARFADEPATLYVASDAEHQRHAAPVVAGLVRHVRSASYAMAAREAAASGASARRAPVLLVLDELAGIAPLHDLPSLVAEGASQGVLTLACLQDLSQARARWGAASDGFLTLFGAKIVLRGLADARTLDALALLAGDEEVVRTTTTVPLGLSGRLRSTRSRTSERVRRLPPDAIAGIPKGSALVFLGGQPFRVALDPVGRGLTVQGTSVVTRAPGPRVHRLPPGRGLAR
ncbi:MAG: TraM recognition domain-containing protein [Actinomycetota bacterium]|nr:TraM recognition domain-containing protein [Actinomycetota bacterium]